MKTEIIKTYRQLLSMIREMIDSIPAHKLFLQSPLYPPSTICHPAWTLGHLCISAQGIGEEMSMPHWLPDDWKKTYDQESNPTGNPGDYHDKGELEKTLEDAVSRLEKRLTAMTKNEWEGLMPDVRYHHVFPTLGHAIAGILVGHVAEHMGMLLMWKYFLLDS